MRSLTIASGFVLLGSLALGGCSKDSGSSQSSGSAAGSSGAAKAAGKASATPPPQISCEKAIPKEIIAKHLPNAVSNWGEPFDNGEGSFITSCRFVEDAIKGRTIVRYKCGPTFTDLSGYAAAVEPQIKSADGSKFAFGRFEGVGRGGLRDKTSVAALHRDMPCLIEVDEMGDREVPDWLPLLIDLEAALTPAAAEKGTGS